MGPGGVGGWGGYYWLGIVVLVWWLECEGDWEGRKGLSGGQMEGRREGGRIRRLVEGRDEGRVWLVGWAGEEGRCDGRGRSGVGGREAEKVGRRVGRRDEGMCVLEGGRERASEGREGCKGIEGMRGRDRHATRLRSTQQIRSSP